MGNYHPIFLISICSVCACIGNQPAARTGEPPAKTYQVKKLVNIHYYKGNDSNSRLHNLDIYLPEGKKNFPTIVYAHGGAWILGDKNQYGIPSALGRSFAKRGIAFVSVNYRLSPGVTHPEHIRDVARAFAWTYRTIGKYGGDPKQLFLSGHSAGAHLVALLATNERYLKEQQLSLDAIRGVMPISGVYTITGERIFTGVFGKSAEARRDASPVYHVSSQTPPFLVLYGDRDLPHCDRPWARKFYKALKAKKVSVDIHEMKGRNHLTILFYAARSDDDPVNQALYRFVTSRTGKVAP